MSQTNQKNDDFGVFQTSENDAWSMGQGLGMLILRYFDRSNYLYFSQPGQHTEKG